MYTFFKDARLEVLYSLGQVRAVARPPVNGSSAMTPGFMPAATP